MVVPSYSIPHGVCQGVSTYNCRAKEILIPFLLETPHFLITVKQLITLLTILVYRARPSLRPPLERLVRV